jgi:hypothetical protein
MILAFCGFGSATIRSEAFPAGVIMFLIGAVLPRIKGNVEASPTKFSATLLGVDELDYSVSGPAVLPVPAEVAGAVHLPKLARSDVGRMHGLGESSGDGGNGDGGSGQSPVPVVLGDVWEALRAKINAPGGFRPLASGFGKSYLQAPDGRTFALPKSGYLDWRPVSGDLLDLLAAWQVEPTPSGQYKTPAVRGAQYAEGPIVAELSPPELQVDSQ